jgi:hypothetical protein
MSNLSLAGRPSRVRTSKRPTAIPVIWPWSALFVNVLAFGGATILPVPPRLGQLVTQGCFVLALALALLANRHGLVKPSLFLVGLSVMAVVAAAVSIHNQFMLGSTFRAGRFVGFVAVLWLLTPWWGRRDMPLLRCHRTCLAVVLVVVLLGLPVSPGMAFTDHRLTGILWPIPPPQVAHYAAVMLGTTVLLWMCHLVGGRSALTWVLVSLAVLVGSHTRTALVALIAGLVCALASLFLSQPRVRRTFLWGGLSIGLMTALFATEIRTWALRGQSSEEVGALTGRTKVWTQVVQVHRSGLQDLAGSGLSNLSWNGLPIDSTWLGTYLDEGLLGVALVALILILLLFKALSHPPGPGRAIALFLIVYCAFASITETGLGAPSPYILDLVVAASLLGTGPLGQST